MTKIVTNISIEENFPEVTDETATFSGLCDVFGEPADFTLTIEAHSAQHIPAAYVTWDEPHPAPLGAERLEAALLSALGVEELRRLQVVAHYVRLESDPDWSREWAPEYWLSYLENADPSGLSGEDVKACDKWLDGMFASGWRYVCAESTYCSPAYLFCDAIGVYAACLPVWFERVADEAAAN